MICPKRRREIDSAVYEEVVKSWVNLGETEEDGHTKIEDWEDGASKKTTFLCPECDEDITAYIEITEVEK